MINKEINATAAIIVQMALSKTYENFQIYKIDESEYGFYIDFYTTEKTSQNDFKKIIKEMNKIISGAYKIDELEEKDFNCINYKKINPNFSKFKLFMANNIIYPSYSSVFLNTNKVKTILLTQIGGIEINENNINKVLTRIHASAFNNEDDLKKFNNLMEELKQRDHRKIGEDLKIFTFDEKSGIGFPIWLPNGNYIKEEISKYLKDFFSKKGFKLISTPILGSKKLYITSGHWDLYKENNFPPIKIDNEFFLLRPMTCPHHMLVFNSIPKSYRDLPYKISEDSKLHRYESSGGLIGLERVRAMELFDSHIFCESNSVEETILELNNIILEVHKKLNIKIDQIDLSLKSNDKDKYYNDEEMWENAENQLKNILNKMGYKYKTVEGEAAFYGPKIDYQCKTTLGKLITISTIQLDFLLPKKFNCKYKDKNGEMKNPTLIHFGVIGTYERFVSILLSQTKGILPFWLMPIQIMIIPINNEFHLKYAKNVFDKLIGNKFKVEINDSNDRLSKKIRSAQISKIPYQIIIGDEEVKSNKNISYRQYGKEDSVSIEINKFIELLNK